MRNETIVIAGYYGFGNAGDELILLSLIRRICAGDPQATITVLSADPAITRSTLGVQAVDRTRPWQWALPMFRADRFILGGGGLLQESTGPWNYIYYLSLVVVAKLFGCLTEIRSVGVDPIARSWNRFWTRFVLHHWTDRLSVRDDNSLRALLEVGVTRPIALERDPVFDLAPGALTQAGRGIALALAGRQSDSGTAVKIAAICDLLSKSGCEPIDLLVLFPVEDEVLAREIAGHSAAIRNLRICRHPEDLLNWIPQYALVGGTRFHALLLAANHHIPIFGWGHQNKVIGLCENYRAPHWIAADDSNQPTAIRALYESSDKSVILTD